MAKWEKEKKTNKTKYFKALTLIKKKDMYVYSPFIVEDSAWSLRWTIRQGKEIKGGIIGEKRNQRILIWRWNDAIYKRPYIVHQKIPTDDKYIQQSDWK